MKTFIFLTVVGYLLTIAVADRVCIEGGGECLNWPTNICLAGWEEDLCQGGRNRRCCLDCDSQCEAEEQVNRQDDAICNEARGNCQLTSNFCNGRYAQGSCGGPANRQCCDPKSSPPEDCPLITFTPTNTTKGLNDYPVRVHPDFVAAMEQIDSVAQECNVTVFITHSFRKRQQRGNGTAGNQGRRNNHLVGHAIDMAGLETSMGFCNGRCLLDQTNVGANCFITGIKDQDTGLIWGGDFTPPDPVHIDDGFAEDANAWKQRLQLLQNNC